MRTSTLAYLSALAPLLSSASPTPLTPALQQRDGFKTTLIAPSYTACQAITLVDDTRTQWGGFTSEWDFDFKGYDQQDFLVRFYQSGPDWKNTVPINTQLVSLTSSIGPSSIDCLDCPARGRTARTDRPSSVP
jgi:hypothetical protein